MAEQFRRRGNSDPDPLASYGMDRNVRGFSDACN